MVAQHRLPQLLHQAEAEPAAAANAARLDTNRAKSFFMACWLVFEVRGVQPPRHPPDGGRAPMILGIPYPLNVEEAAARRGIFEIPHCTEGASKAQRSELL